MIWNLYTRRTKGLLIPARLVMSGGEPRHGWGLDSSFEADDEDEAQGIALALADIVSVEVAHDWSAKHRANVLRAHGIAPAPKSKRRRAPSGRDGRET